MIIHQRISTMVILSLIFLSHRALCQFAPQIEFDGKRVWVKNIDPEVLYTFSRYNHEQKDWQAVFPVTTKEAEGKIGIDGHYEVQSASVSFTPRYQFANGVDYIATFYLQQLTQNPNEVYLAILEGNVLRSEFKLNSGNGTSPQVVAIYPSPGMLPENLLKFHIVFNTPMTTGEVYKRVTLYDQQNKPVDKAFLIIDQELWDAEMKTVTVMLDPGRIKRGLKANLQLGAPMKAGEKYTLVVASGWKDHHGELTSASFKKTFRCSAADRASPDITDWKIIPPSSNRDPLILEMKESMNIIMIPDAIRIADALGNPISGRVTFLKDESILVFTPDLEWPGGEYTLRVNPLFEDVAGNNLHRLFDEDLQHTSGNAKSEYAVRFTVSTSRAR